MVRLTGPVVRELDAVFVTDWFSETDELLPLDTSPVRPSDDPDLVDAQVLPGGPSFDNDNNLKLFAAMIHNARKRISITSPYYVPDDTTKWPSSPLSLAALTWSSSSLRSATSSWSSTPNARTTNSCCGQE
jgi:phosphatidylserine/phosphatidylglycerophosphate/cardiolipin synthase-like enzyme